MSQRDVDSGGHRDPGYRLAGRGRQHAEGARLGLLEELYDPGSRRRRDLVQPGWHCLEVGAGHGSMAAWLAEAVGPTGHVVAIDIDVTFMEWIDLPNVEVRRHDILEDSLERLGPGSFDLVCSRLMLFWLAGRQEAAIGNMVACLRPGGWLVDEDGDWGTPGPVDPSHHLYKGYHDAFRDGEWWNSRGYDPVFGRKLPVLFERCGLQNIRHQASTQVVRGASPWARWWRESLDAIRAAGLSAETPTEASASEHEALTTPCTDPTVWLLREILHSCRGQRH